MVKFPSYEDVQNARAHFSNLSYEHWINDDFLTWRWWLLLALSIVPWLIWAKIVDKQRIHEILLYGFYIGILAITLDNIGTELLWWGYPDKLLQMVPPLIPADLALVPTSLMVIYQYFPKWKPFFIANLIVGAFLCYVAEPVFIWLDFYQLYTWKLTYSYIFYVVAAMSGRWVVMKTLSEAQRSTHPEVGRTGKP